jgi:hypothetical protein
MMQLQFLSVLSVLICSTIGTAQILPTGPILDYPQLQLLHALCESGGSNSVSIISHHFHTNFNNSDMITVRCGSVLGQHLQILQYGECLPYALDGATISGAIFCKSATCYNKGCV